MSKRTYTSLPNNYPVCKHGDCKLSATCLHQIAYTALQETEEVLRLINPKRCSKDEKCAYYRNNSPVKYAIGFTNFQKRMFPDQYQKFMSILISHFGRNPYFERRRGETPLSPKEQELVLNTLKEVGVTEEIEFDAYEENINWYD